jgi:hypothetical protein
MPNPDEGIAQPSFHCGIPRCSPCFAMMLQILAVKSALCTGLPPRRLVVNSLQIAVSRDCLFIRESRAGIKRILRLLCLTLVHLRRPISARPGARSGHGRPKTCLLNACTCEGTRARPGFSDSNARSTYTPCGANKTAQAPCKSYIDPQGRFPGEAYTRLTCARH